MRHLLLTTALCLTTLSTSWASQKEEIKESPFSSYNKRNNTERVQANLALKNTNEEIEKEIKKNPTLRILMLQKKAFEQLAPNTKNDDTLDIGLHSGLDSCLNTLLTAECPDYRLASAYSYQHYYGPGMQQNFKIENLPKTPLITFLVHSPTMKEYFSTSSDQRKILTFKKDLPPYYTYDPNMPGMQKTNDVQALFQADLVTVLGKWVKDETDLPQLESNLNEFLVTVPKQYKALKTDCAIKEKLLNDKLNLSHFLFAKDSEKESDDQPDLNITEKNLDSLEDDFARLSLAQKALKALEPVYETVKKVVEFAKRTGKIS